MSDMLQIVVTDQRSLSLRIAPRFELDDSLSLELNGVHAETIYAVSRHLPYSFNFRRLPKPVNGNTQI